MTNEMVKFSPGKVGTMSDDVMERLAAAYSPEDNSEQVETLKRLKINYDSDSKVAKPGEWVVGQQKKDAEITEEGDRVIGFIPIVIRNAYSLYDEDDTSNNCNSPVFKDFGDEVCGNNYGNVCGKKTCSYAAAGDCKAQKVAYGVALTQKSGFVDCQAYFSGVGYMPFSEYISSTSKGVLKGMPVNIPPFSYIASLTTKKHKKGSVTYYEPVFAKGGELSKPDDIESLKAKRHEILQMIEHRAEELAAKAKEAKGEKAPEKETGSVTMADLMKASGGGVVDISDTAKVEEPETKEPEEDNSVEDLLKAAGADTSPSETGEALSISDEIERALAGG